MLLSFSVPSMLPMIRAGLRQRAGERVGGERVKRQTMRALGPRAEKLLSYDPIGHTIPYDLDLWWKSRTPAREHLGKVKAENGCFIKVYKLDIMHSFVEPTNAPKYPVVRINGPRGWRHGDPTCWWSPGDAPSAFGLEAFNDGFDSPEEFRDYFVPNMGDRFDAILFKW